MDKDNEEYRQLLTLYVTILESVKGTNFPATEKWLYSVEPLAIKLFYHVGSVYYLCHGTKIGGIAGLNIDYIDHSSAAVVTRCAFETYLTFHYIFISANNDAEIRFKHKIWELGGICEQQKYPPFHESIKKHLEDIKDRKTKMVKVIKKDTVYKKLEEKAKKEVIRGKWRYGYSWADLAEQAGFDKKMFRGLYGYLSDYAHTGNLSSNQIGSAIARDDQLQLTGITKTICMILISHFIHSYSKIFPQCRQVLIENPALSQVAKKWFITFAELWQLNEG